MIRCVRSGVSMHIRFLLLLNATLIKNLLARLFTISFTKYPLKYPISAGECSKNCPPNELYLNIFREDNAVLLTIYRQHHNLSIEV